MNKIKFSLAFLSIFFSFLIVSSVFAGGSIMVTSNDLESSIPAALSNDKWFFYNDQTDVIDNTLGSFVTGPATAPIGQGSAQISVSGEQRRNIATYQFRGTPLANITELKYSTYNPSAGNGGSVNRSGYLQFNVDFNGSDTWQRRLLFLPSDNGIIQQDTWQEWDTLNGGAALWRYSGTTWPVTGEPGSTPKTWNQILTDYSGVRIRATDAWFGIRVGEPYPDGYTENIDLVKFGVSGLTKWFDFEPLIGPPTTFVQCKNNGWKTFNNPAFKNKEKCEKYVKQHMKTITAKDIIYTANGLKREADMNMNTGDNGGSFEYDDAAKGWYNVKVSSVKVDGNFGYFAGRVMKASNPAWVGLWLFGKVENGTPDKIWGSFTDETTALAGVESMSTPADGPFTITKKDIKIK